MQLTVADVVAQTADIKSFVLRRPDGQQLPGFAAGAHVNVEVTLPDGKLARRSYSLVTPSQTSDCSLYEIAVLRQAQGRGGSLHMHDVLKIGSLVEVSEPVNGFPLADTGRRHTLIAGGIGITPILCMAQVLVASGELVTLHYFGRAADKLAYLELLRSLPGLDLHTHLGSDVSETRSILTAALGPPEDGHHVYVCGPGGMIQSLIELAAVAAWPESHVHYELFGGQVVGTNNRAFTVHLVQSGQNITVPADITLLDALLAHGVDAPFDCKSGICGTCLTSVNGGEIDHRDSFLTEEDRLDGSLICTCVSRAAAGSTLSLDL